MQVHKFHSPFSHWFSGLLFELAAMAVFIALVAGLVTLIARFV